MPDGVRVTTAAEAAARDALAIASGIPSFALMLQAGTAAAAHIVRVASHRLAFGVHVYAGSGNNGGDGYIVAAQLRRLGVRVLLHEVAAPRTPDAIAAAQLARRHLATEQFVASEDTGVASPARVATFTMTNAVFVDAMLGTGAIGPLRGAIARAAHIFRRARDGGALIVSLDVPTGLDASTGELAQDHVVAHHTLTFGTCKAGLLSARAACGEITVLDIGLGAHAEISDDAARLADARALRATLPAIAWNAHKGTRGRVLIVGGAPGMAGAAQLAARGALVSGAGLVRAYVHPSSVRALQASTPAVVCEPWRGRASVVSPGRDKALRTSRDALQDPALDESITTRERDEPLAASIDAFANWAHVVAIGPGLGRDRVAEHVLRETIRRVSEGNACIVFDADALTLLGSLYSPDEIRRLAASRRIVLTPHAGEFATLARAFNIEVDTQSPEFARDVSVRRRSAAALATQTGCVVLLKGTPSIVVAPEGDAWIVPRGTAALATGGTGDVLTGVIAAVLASQHAAPRESLAQSEPHSEQHSATNTSAETCALAATAAWVHGVAGEHTASRIGVRGSTVEDIVHALPSAWSALTHPAPLSPDVLSVVPPCGHE